MKTDNLYRIFIAPRSTDANLRSQEVVLNWLLVGSLGLTAATFIITLVDFVILRAPYLPGRLVIVLIPFGFFGLLLFMSRRYQQRVIPSAILVAIFFAAATSVLFQWDISNPFGILLFSVAIVMAGILLGARFSLYMALLTAATLSVYRYGKLQHYWTPNLAWEHKTSGPADIVSFTAVYAILALTSWLFNRQMELALTRAKRSERALKRQRDSLEITVAQRTRELQAAQLEQIQEVYRFAELGHLSTALFHDMANHLMTVSIDIEGLQQKDNSELFGRLQENVGYINNVVKRVRRQINGQVELERFNVNEEIGEIIKMLAYHSDKAAVTVELKSPSRQKITYRGDVTRFRQIIVNLLSNAIEAYEAPVSRRGTDRRTVQVVAARVTGSLIITVIDHGKTIKPEVQAKIFEPFYSTKDKGMGIGLFIVKKITEQDFGGSISLTSTKQAGTSFAVTLPLKRHGR